MGRTGVIRVGGRTLESSLDGNAEEASLERRVEHIGLRGEKL